ncbi:MAG: HI0074 family nucleotidyltransferase substrate-binding subunit, partial [Elusimicrobiota bacterium]
AYLEKMGLNDEKRKKCRKRFPWIFKKYGPKPSFHDFCSYLESGGLYEDKHWAPQVSLMSLPPEEFDFIGNIENIEQDFKKVAAKVKALSSREIKRGGAYTGASDKINKYYDNKTVAVISRLYKEDFETFNYDYMDGFPGKSECKYVEQFEKAVSKLEQALKEPKNDFIRDSAIKRFEICYELSWKLIKWHLKEKGIISISPRDCFKEAYRQKLIDYNNKWLDMIEDRNLTSHIYNEKTAEEIYGKLKEYLELYKKLASNIQKNMQP